MNAAPNPIFCDDGGKLPIIAIHSRKLRTDNCAIEPQSENYSNAEIIAELNRVKCEFQLRTICAVMAMTHQGHPITKGEL